ncbi:MAG TPA: nitroreductase family protein [Anaerolineales bacterium]|nr:nitroreductase family protein [Anaerolineales bacterium]
MTLQDFLRSRRSVRRFKTDPIPESVVARILETATCAPSAHNLQPWRLAVVTSPAVKEHLAGALTDKMRLDMRAEGAPESEIEKRVSNSMRRIGEAPVIIMLCREPADVRLPTPEETIMNIQSTALAGLQLLLAAHAEGLGANWICWPLYAGEATRAALKLPESWEPQAMIMIGQEGELPKAQTRKSVEQVAIWR